MDNWRAFSPIRLNVYSRFGRTYCQRGIGYFHRGKLHCFECYEVMLDLFRTIGEPENYINRGLWHVFGENILEEKECYLCGQEILQTSPVENCPDCSAYYESILTFVLEQGLNERLITGIQYDLLLGIIQINLSLRTGLRL